MVGGQREQNRLEVARSVCVCVCERERAQMLTPPFFQ
jgi:hypothetical protein